MSWFGFGFNGFGQIVPRARGSVGVKVLFPERLECCDCDVGQTRVSRAEKDEQLPSGTEIRATWSRLAVLHRQTGDGHVCISGFVASPPNQNACTYVPATKGCHDALIGERYLTASFADKIECWDIGGLGSPPVWRMELTNTDAAALPLAPGGYAFPKTPFYRALSPQICAQRLALGAEHAVLLSTDGTVYTWGLGSHGQLGHGSVESQSEPLAVEVLRGLPMGDVAAGGWHSVCISAGGDLYVWGWNEAGQLGLPSRSLRAQAEHSSAGEAGCATIPTRQEAAETQEGEGSEVFISIQAFPALLDLPEESEIKKMSCGSRHTAAVTCDYGQLGHGAPRSSDQPLHVEYFTKEGLCVLDVVCGSWNTFVLASERAPSFE
ncbi:RCC1 domain-containing protein 1-like isoform X3 [Polyodon spathula]|uniref:RCC1 domain-containing protein 1-like isoform X3 n=1 Tax=Polyodon spathula TaxID=7913 RepID=UPI001B7E988D|nr:RCC1 domain-containing protein 1-like isoform X3 [Polyodon spathula]